MCSLVQSCGFCNPICLLHCRWILYHWATWESSQQVCLLRGIYISEATYSSSSPLPLSVYCPIRWGCCCCLSRQVLHESNWFLNPFQAQMLLELLFLGILTFSPPKHWPPGARDTSWQQKCLLVSIHIFPQTFYSSSMLRYTPKLAEEKAPRILSCVRLSKLGSLKHLIEVIKDRNVVSLAITMPKVNHCFWTTKFFRNPQHWASLEQQCKLKCFP